VPAHGGGGGGFLGSRTTGKRSLKKLRPEDYTTLKILTHRKKEVKQTNPKNSKKGGENGQDESGKNAQKGRGRGL